MKDHKHQTPEGTEIPFNMSTFFVMHGLRSTNCFNNVNACFEANGLNGGVNITIRTQTVDYYEKTCFEVFSNMRVGYCTTEQCEHRPHATSKRSSQSRLIPGVTTLLLQLNFSLIIPGIRKQKCLKYKGRWGTPQCRKPAWEFLFNKTNRRTNFPNLFLLRNAICFGQFLCPSSGVFQCTFGTRICHAGLMTAFKHDIYQCRMYSGKHLMMGRGTARNM